MPADALIELARQVRGETLRLLECAREDWLLRPAPGTSNHILWHAGHALWVQDVLFIEPLTGTSELVPGWPETFGMNGRPPRLTRDWPTRGEVQQRLAAQLARVVGLLQSLGSDQLAANAPPMMDGRNLLSCLVHAWHDEAKHSGEMYLLIKMWRASAGEPR